MQKNKIIKQKWIVRPPKKSLIITNIVQYVNVIWKLKQKLTSSFPYVELMRQEPIYWGLLMPILEEVSDNYYNINNLI